ncbi:IdsF [Serratia marcescens]|uniref:IdsF n=1 Tax=Serratia marcescens TaxID=615 RepID=A0A5C7CKB0_SERMA|nr:IdsF [Serratia marcescens]TXE37220.1 IdsF [Serratia marcescens]TXE68283.1 IdsF [Serratia marcescens]
MINWKRKLQNTAFIFFNLCLMSISTQVGATKVNDVKYLISFNSYKSSCLLRVNDLPGVDTSRANNGTMSAGYNTTSFLANGNNTIELLMGPEKPEDRKTLYPDSSCVVTVSKDTKDTSIEIAKFILGVNNKGEITARESSFYNGGTYNSKIIEGYTKNENDYGLYKLSSNLLINDLPRWEWTKATPVTERDLPIIRKAYENIWWMIQKRDIDSLKKISQISINEMAYAEGTTTGIIFVSTDFPAHVLDKSLTPVPIDWNHYKLITYNHGRLFRMGVGFYQNSPLRFKNDQNVSIFSYNPYFSIINGKVVLVR